MVRQDVRWTPHMLYHNCETTNGPVASRPVVLELLQPHSVAIAGHAGLGSHVHVWLVTKCSPGALALGTPAHEQGRTPCPCKISGHREQLECVHPLALLRHGAVWVPMATRFLPDCQQ